MAEKLVFSAEAIILCVTALIFSADKDAFTKDVDLAPELAKPGAITFEGYATLVMEKLSQSFASSSCHRVIGDILMGKQCATTIVGEINASRDTNAALMAEKLVFSAEAIILCVTALIFSADKDAFTKEVDLAPELAKPGAITFEGYATLVNAYVMALWVCVTKRFSDAVILKVMEKLSQSFASSSCHRVIGDIPMGKQCATTIVGEINASRDISELLQLLPIRLGCVLYPVAFSTSHF
ncbi:hypothetical protein Bca4012_081438 [Brassica carinata]